MDARIPASVPDDALEEYIAEMILQEARQKDKAYREQGISAFRAPDLRPGRTNKRFLASTIRNADSHNQRQETHEARRGSARKAVRMHSDRLRGYKYGTDAKDTPGRGLERRTARPRATGRRSTSPDVGPMPAPRVREWDLGKEHF
ncbi:hypothetical protein MVES_000810 [Malassezia vespertilionis]|uniref:Uncharacterized protein n=1 Tax=Malassezia vespertilionis TaxID=2020962 RepID=A0A2N1JED2_9BASI|nr:hypothetical protein MVES_000810 [Malassezia vespertilionis]